MALPFSPAYNEETSTDHYYPFSPRKFYSEDFSRNFPMYRAKTADFASMLRVRSAASYALHSFFHQRGFVQIHTPVLTSNDCEGAGEVFTVAADTKACLVIFLHNKLSEIGHILGLIQTFFWKKKLKGKKL